MKNILLSAILMGSMMAVAAETKVVTLTIKNGTFSPDRLQVPAGEKFRLEIKNEGPGAEEFESAELNREKVIPMGKTVTIFLGPLKQGEYKFFGEFHPETANGVLVAK